MPNTPEALAWLIRAGTPLTQMQLEATATHLESLAHIHAELGRAAGVPAEPTAAMLQAAVGTQTFCLGETSARRVWKAMFAAALNEVGQS